jgi:ubiquinol-cytochrome c reductase iron-sulfur subunit
MTQTRPKTQSARREFVVQLAATFAGVGGTASLWPLVDQMNPSLGSPAPEVTDVDLGTIRPGQTTWVQWRHQPISLRHRTQVEVQLAREATLSDFIDPFARNASLPGTAPATDANRTKAGHDHLLVVVGLCTHLGCRLTTPVDAPATATAEGWFCPCHAARFDLSGRVLSGPARTNLPVPPYRFLTPLKIRIG